MFDSPLKDGIVIVFVLLLFFGAKRLPELSRALGASVKEFKTGISDGTKSDAQKSEISGSAAAEPTVKGSQHTNA